MSKAIETDQAITYIKKFIVDSLEESGLDGYVIGLSGGIDSALSATLAAAAVGCDKVFGVMMPYRLSNPNSLADATILAGGLKIDYRTIDISPMIDSYYDEIDLSMRLRAGNKMARERMSVLFDLAHQQNRLVLGTGNRTEICLGYTTLYGDSACSVDPIGELYKTEVQQLSAALEIPANILAKPPSADLWADQTDEGEIGVTYEEIDSILRKIVDERIFKLDELVAAGHRPDQIERVVGLLNRNSFKRELPPVASLGRLAVPHRVNLG